LASSGNEALSQGAAHERQIALDAHDEGVVGMLLRYSREVRSPAQYFGDNDIVIKVREACGPGKKHFPFWKKIAEGVARFFSHGPRDVPGWSMVSGAFVRNRCRRYRERQVPIAGARNEN
jgi:hypothetical protein